MQSETAGLQTLLENINWKEIESCRESFVHGNLWLENIFFDQQSSSLQLIDPSPLMPGKGDWYLDLAKLYGSLRHQFDEKEKFIELIEQFFKHQQINIYKVKTIAALSLLEHFTGHKLSLFRAAKTLLEEAQNEHMPDIIPFHTESAK